MFVPKLRSTSSGTRRAHVERNSGTNVRSLQGGNRSVGNNRPGFEGEPRSDPEVAEANKKAQQAAFRQTLEANSSATFLLRRSCLRLVDVARSKFEVESDLMSSSLRGKSKRGGREDQANVKSGKVGPTQRARTAVNRCSQHDTALRRCSSTSAPRADPTTFPVVGPRSSPKVAEILLQALTRSA